MITRYCVADVAMTGLSVFINREKEIPGRIRVNPANRSLKKAQRVPLTAPFLLIKTPNYVGKQLKEPYIQGTRQTHA